MLAVIAVVLALPSLLQEPGSPAGVRDPLVEVVALDLPAAAPARVERTMSTAGTVHAWTSKCAIDLSLAIEDASGKILVEDQDSGGGTTPCARLDVVSGQRLTLRVAAQKPGEHGSCELHLALAPETDATRAAADRAKAEIQEIHRLREAKETAAARRRLEALIAELLAVPGREASSLLCARLESAAIEAARLALLSPEERARRAVEAWRSRFLPEEHPDLLRARGSLATTLRKLGDAGAAREIEEQVLEVRTRTLPADHPEIQRARQSLALTLKRLDEHGRARELEEQVLEVRERTLPSDDPEIQSVRQNLAITLKRTGELARARELEEQVLEVRTRTLREDDPDLPLTMGNLAETIRLQGDLPRARSLQERALALRTRALPEDHAEVVTSYNNLAIVLHELGDLHAARALKERVLDLRTKRFAEDHPDVQRARVNLAVTMLELGDLTGARAILEQALAVSSRRLPEGHLDLQYVRANLAHVLRRLGDLGPARKLEERVIEIWSERFPPEYPDLLGARANLGITLRAQQEYSAARAIQEGVLEMRSRILPAGHPSLEATRQSLAVTLRLEGDLGRSRALLEQVVAGLEGSLPADDPQIQDARLDLALACAFAGDLTPAREQMLAWCRRRSALARDSLGRGSPREVESWLRPDAWGMSVALSLAASTEESPGELTLAALTVLENVRNLGLVSARLAAHARDPASSAARDEARAASSDLARLAQRGASRDEINAALAHRDAAQRELLRRLSGLPAARSLLAEPTLASLSAGLSADAALVGYSRYERYDFGDQRPAEREVGRGSLLAFVIRPDGALHRVELGPIEPIESAVRGWRESVGAGVERGLAPGRERGHESGEGDPRGAELRRLIFDPLRPAIGKSKRLIVALDDELHAVPLDALPADDSGSELLGARLEIEVRLSLRDGARGESRDATGTALVALGGPAFNSAPAALDAAEGSAPGPEPVAEVSPTVATAAFVLRGGAWERGFQPLPESAAEARGIAELHAEVFGEKGAARVLEKRRASRAAVEALAPGARWLHLATHGWFAPESVRAFEDREPLDAALGLRGTMSREEQVRAASPMVLCGLALAGANLPVDSLGRTPGIVTAEEIATWDLAGCELAVLSACDTNVGVRRAGQGVASLQKALHMAGARTVITSLWKVPDEATKELMLDFYRRIWVEKKPKAQALWEAKTRLREAKDESGRPKYTTRDWAAWVLTGDPR